MGRNYVRNVKANFNEVTLVVNDVYLETISMGEVGRRINKAHVLFPIDATVA